MEKETLEEASEKYLQEWRLVNNIHLSNSIHAERCKNDFKAGASWQAERMYSEEDLISFYDFIENHQLRKYENIWKRITNDPNVRPLNFESVDDKYIIEWFEQFKKK